MAVFAGEFRAHERPVKSPAAGDRIQLPSHARSGSVTDRGAGIYRQYPTVTLRRVPGQGHGHVGRFLAEKGECI